MLWFTIQTIFSELVVNLCCDCSWFYKLLWYFHSKIILSVFVVRVYPTKSFTSMGLPQAHPTNGYVLCIHWMGLLQFINSKQNLSGPMRVESCL